MELLKNFGVNPLLLVAQIVNFLVILFVLKRFLYKPVFEVLKNREKTIKEGIEKAQEATLILENAKNEENKILKNAQMESKKLIEDAKEQSVLLAKQLEESAKKRAEIILMEAKEEIQKESKEAETKIMRNISELAVQFLQKSLSELVTKRAQEEIVVKALKQLQKKPN